MSNHDDTKPSDPQAPLAEHPECPVKPPKEQCATSIHEPSSPSSYYNSGSVSAGNRSTGKTSLESNVASIRSRSRGKGDEAAPDKPLAPIAETVIEQDLVLPPWSCPTPTITTVELTANTKIFFETYFNSLLSSPATPRSIRRNEIIQRLDAMVLSPEQRQQELLDWATGETECLRQHRVLKSRTNQTTGSRGIDIAGYEVVRILGKGSFGIVRLVRERDFDSTVPYDKSQCVPRDGNGKIIVMNSSRSHPDNKRVNPRDAAIMKGGKRQVYAMKVIRKSDMLRNSQEGHLRAERDCLVASEKSRWVVPLIASFQDLTNLYLVMEYMVGGDFLGLLFRKDILKERKARWYIAEMILCVEEAHKLRWIHRDVKPDNFLISASGHLKISDFGLAFDGHWAHDQSFFNNHRQSLMEKLGIEVEGDSLDRKEGASIAANIALADVLTGGRKERRDKMQIEEGPRENEGTLQWRDRVGKRKLARSVVGTSQYMAPEVIRGELYDGRCDWWSIGIILYEVITTMIVIFSHDPQLLITSQCIYGYTPFVCETRQDTKLKILVSLSCIEWHGRFIIWQPLCLRNDCRLNTYRIIGQATLCMKWSHQTWHQTQTASAYKALASPRKPILDVCVSLWLRADLINVTGKCNVPQISLAREHGQKRKGLFRSHGANQQPAAGKGTPHMLEEI